MAEKKVETKAKTKPKTKKRPRIYLLDELRGFAIICMVFNHAFYTVGIFFDWGWGKMLLDFFAPAEPFFAGLFILISGICSNLSRSNIERGAKLFFIAYILTVVTYFVVGNESAIRFGILHMLSICMMLYGILSGICKYIPMWIGIIVNAAMFVFTFGVTSGYVGIPFVWTFRLPIEWYQTDFLYPLGFVGSGFSSGDYFALLPWLFLFFAGGYFGRLAAQNKFPKAAYKNHIPFLSFLGKYSLIIYLAHQPVIFGICEAVKYIVK